MEPKRALQGARPTRVIMAMLAVAFVVALVASFVAAPSVDRSQERTDPVAAVPAQPQDRGQRASRSDARTPLPAQGPASPSPPSPSASPSPSPSPSPTAPESASPSAAAAPASGPAETPSPSPDPEPIPEDGTVTGEMWATAPVNIRSGPGTGFGVITAVGKGDEVTVTNVVVDSRWQQVKRGERIGFVSNKYLTDDEPAAPAPADDSDDATEVPEPGVSTASCPAAARVESGLTERTRGVLRAICNEFPNVGSYGGYRSGGGSYHSQGRAIDVMISGEAGWEVARWVRANAGELGVIEIIYAQRIWTTQRAGEGWRGMADRGSSSANHYDHVHVSVR